MNKVEQLIHREYVELSEKFRPEFGNLKHIEITNEMVELNKLSKTYEQKIEAATDLKQLRDNIRKLKRNILFHLKNV